MFEIIRYYWQITVVSAVPTPLTNDSQFFLVQRDGTPIVERDATQIVNQRP